MKTLLLLRHAKSSWDDPALDDFDRPLNARGRAAAARMGEELRTLDLQCDLALVSPARRSVETFELVRSQWPGCAEWRFEPRLYLASPDEMLAVAREAANGVDRLMLVGHNPGMHELAVKLTAGDASQQRKLIAAKFPTGALAKFALPVDRWEAAGESPGKLVRFARPRDL